MATFAEKLKALRERAGVSQGALAQLAGLALNTVASLEQGRRHPTWAVVQSLADALGVSTERLRDRAKPRARKAKKGE